MLFDFLNLLALFPWTVAFKTSNVGFYTFSSNKYVSVMKQNIWENWAKWTWVEKPPTSIVINVIKNSTSAPHKHPLRRFLSQPTCNELSGICVSIGTNLNDMDRILREHRDRQTDDVDRIDVELYYEIGENINSFQIFVGKRLVSLYKCTAQWLHENVSLKFIILHIER